MLLSNGTGTVRSHFTLSYHNCWVDSGICEGLFFQRVAEGQWNLWLLTQCRVSKPMITRTMPWLIVPRTSQVGGSSLLLPSSLIYRTEPPPSHTTWWERLATIAVIFYTDILRLLTSVISWQRCEQPTLRSLHTSNVEKVGRPTAAKTNVMYGIISNLHLSLDSPPVIMFVMQHFS